MKEDEIVLVDEDGRGWTQSELDEAEARADIAEEGRLEDESADDAV